MIFIETPSNDPYWNLAAEDYVFNHMPKDQSYFMLWQNKNAVIVGRYQNTVAEVNSDFVDKNGILVARRLSGGGAVYHDLGNVNYTFITNPDNMEELNLHAFCKPLQKTLLKMGVPAEISGRNDVLINGMKCSGCSQYIQNGRLMHHGCVMFDTDLSILSKALNYRPEKYSSKGKPSIRSRVTNISDYLDAPMDVSSFKNLMKLHMSEGHSLKAYFFSNDDHRRIQRLRDEKYATWEWNYGFSPAYDVTFSHYMEGCGFVELSYNVKDGIIQNFESRGDYFGSGDMTDIKKRLIGTPIRRDCLEQALLHFPLSTYYNGLKTDTFLDLLLGNLDVSSSDT